MTTPAPVGLDRIDPLWAWAPDKDRIQGPWRLRWAGHLLRRAGFGGSWLQLQAAAEEGPQRTLDRLLAPPANYAAFQQQYDELESGGAASDDGAAATLRAWWLRRMIETPAPLQEKLTLFWHGLFPLSGTKVGSARLLHQHVRLLRTHALGSFRELLAGLVRDPAMIIGLAASTVRGVRPGEEYARRFLAMLGLWNAGLENARSFARACSGWVILRHELHLVDRERDTGVKEFFGHRGPLERDDLPGILLEQPAVADHIVRRLFAYLVAEDMEVPDGLVAPLASAFRKDYHIGRLVERILRSHLFFSPAAFWQRVKSPLELAIGIAQAMEGRVPTEPLGPALVGLGQDLFEAPTDDGWPGGRAWLNPFTVVSRQRLASAMLSAEGPYGGKLDPKAVISRHGLRGRSAASFLGLLLLQSELSGEPRGDDPRQMAIQLAHLPEFQLA